MMFPKEVHEKWAKEFEEYSKHWPWYTKVSWRTPGGRWQRMCCKLGMHIPVKTYDPKDEDTYEVFCQVCLKGLTGEDWNKFWKGRR